MEGNYGKTSFSIQKEIDTLEKRIRDYQDAINDAQYSIERKKLELEKVLQYEKRPRDQKELIRRLYNDTPTVPLMDEYETLTSEGYYKYERLVLQDCLWHNSSLFSYVVERRNERDCVGNITLTELKKGEDWDLSAYAKETIDHYNSRKKTKRINPGTIVFFKKPYLLRAQTSANRTGYGNYYEGNDLVYEGTLYGETTSYVIIGVMAQRF